jgi:branched-chain amino acid transport system permease protein
MVMVVLGGPGTLYGPLLGAGLYLGLETTLGAWTENWQLLLGAVLLAVVLASRGGLGGLVARLSGRQPG